VHYDFTFNLLLNILCNFCHENVYMCVRDLIYNAVCQPPKVTNASVSA